MKQLISNYEPIFNPAARQLDFTPFPNFNVNKLYAVINITANAPIYIAGAPGLGIDTATTANAAPRVISLQYDTTAQSPGDTLNVYYDAESGGVESNTPVEHGGNLEKISILLQHMLTEIKVLNFQVQSLIAGPVGGTAAPDLEDLRQSAKNPAEWEDLGNVN